MPHWPASKRRAETSTGSAASAPLRGPTAADMAFEDDDHVLQNAAFGLTHVEFKRPKRGKSLLGEWLGGTRSRAVAPSPQRTNPQSSKTWSGHRMERLLQRLVFCDAVATMMLVPLRIGFFLDPFNGDSTRRTWTPTLTTFAVLDFVSAIITFLSAVRTFVVGQMVTSTSRRGSDPQAMSTFSAFRRMSRMPSRIMPEEITLKRMGSKIHIGNGSRSDEGDSLKRLAAAKASASRQRRIASACLEVIAVVPWELVLNLVGEFNLAHVGGCIRFIRSLYSLRKLFTTGILKQFRSSALVRNLAFSTISLLFHSTWTGLYLCHLAACGYMLIAHVECGIKFSRCSKVPIPGCWVLKDELEHGSIWRQYVRTMYWASKTITTLGQGDLVPATEMETNYCICVQFISGLWATACLSACGFLFSRRDANMRHSTATQFEQCRQFLGARKLSPSTTVDVLSYFRFIQRTRDGIDELSVFEGLPNRYRAQCSHQIKQGLVKRIPFFRKHEGAFLRAILDALQLDYFSPQQTIVDFGDREELFVVSTGEVRVSNTEKVVVRRLLAGNYYADQALAQVSVSQHLLIAETSTEIWWLTQKCFEQTVTSYFPAHRRAAILGRRSSSTDASGGVVAVAEPRDIALRKLMDKVDRDTAKSVRSIALWRMPSSGFRVKWRAIEFACIMYVATEVPIHIAFNRDFGLLASSGVESNSPALKVRFCISFLVEVFFYMNWLFRAWMFVRRTTDTDEIGEDKNTREDSQQNLIVESKQILRHYLEHDDIVADMVSNIPVALVWDIFPKESMNPFVILLMGCSRMLRLVRVKTLRNTMKFVMTRKNLSPPTQLLLFNIVVCVLLANAAASVYFAVGGFTTEKGSIMRANLTWRHSVSASSCLADASIHGNCTWYIYDYSEYGIEGNYLRSVHWSIVLLSTVGYGDILAFSNLECVIGFFWIYAGAIICYFTASAVSSVISHWRVLKAAKNERLEEINRTLLSFKNLSPATISMIQRYYVATWKINGSATTETAVLHLLPKSLRSSIARELYMKIALSKMFANIESGTLVKELAVMARSEVFLSRMKITGQGHTALEAFIVQSGAVELYVEAQAEELLPQLSQVATDRRQSQLRARLQQRLSDSSLAHRTDTDKGVPPNASGPTTTLSISVLTKSDVFGEESFSYPELSVYTVSARTVANTHVIVLHRNALLDLRDRFPTEFARITNFVQSTMNRNRLQLDVLRKNFLKSRKIVKSVGLVSTTTRLDESRATEQFIVHPESTFAQMWSGLVASILLYNFYQIVFRLAFLPRPAPATAAVLNYIDYTFDMILVFDMLLKWNHLGYADYSSGDVLERSQIRKHYQNGWLKWDLLSVIPIYFPHHPFKMALGRLPRLLRCPQLLSSLRVLEEKVHEHFISGGTVFLSVFDMVKFLLSFLSAAHYLGSCYYLLGRLQLESGVVTSSWITADAVLNAYPGRIDVHYVRSVYWCLETFTVVCFGDVIARNRAETIFASATCILGWVFIGQIIGRMTSLVLKLDKEAYEHIERINDFEEYAKRRSLPPIVRERAKECAEYKSKTILELNARDVLQDLPTRLRTVVFDEAYGNLVRGIPEFDQLSKAQIQALASAFTLEIFMRRDVIFAEGRVSTRLYIMKEGRGELFSDASSIVLASIHEGVMFGDTAFFIPGVKNAASARAYTSCQVLQLERQVWKSLWPEHICHAIEDNLISLMREKHRLIMESYLNVVKNFELSKNTITQRPLMPRRKRTLRSIVLADKGKLERQLLVCYSIRAPKKTKLSISSVLQSVRSIASGLLDRLATLSSSNVPGGPASPLLLNAHGPPSTSTNRNRLRSSLAKIRPARADKESLWDRHSNKLRVLRMLDDKKIQAEADLNAQTPRTRVEDYASWRVSARSHRFGLVRRKSTGQSPDGKQMADISTPTNASQNPSGTSSRSSREDQPAQFRRHSIQLNQDDLMKKLGALRDIRDESTIRAVDVSKALEQRHPSHALRTNSIQHAEKKVPDALLKKGRSSITLSAQAPHLRKRSNSFHELLTNAVDVHGARRRVSFFTKALGDAIHNAFKPLQSISQLYGIWSEPPPPPPFVLQGSSFRRAWDVLMLLACLYYVLVIPFRASFTYEVLTASGHKTSVDVWFAFEYAIDALCWIDFFLRKNYFVFVHRGQLVTDSKAIRDHYFRDGTYVIDLITMFPLEILAPAVVHIIPDTVAVTWYHIAVLRLNKNLRIIHLHELSERVQQMLVYDFKVKIIRRSFVVWTRFTFDFVLGAHLVACMAYAVAFNTYDGSRNSWLTAPGMLTFAGCDGLDCIGATPVIRRYARSYHFSMGAITTVSYGDIAPLNAAETGATVIVIMASIILFGMLSGGFFQFFEMEIGRRADYEQRVAQVAQYMQFHRFHPRLWRQMQVYFAVHWAESKGMNEDALLRGLTTSVKQDIAFFVMEDFVKNMKLFAGAEPAFARAVITAFQQELFVRNDIIICEGDTERSLYVIESGLVSVRITKKTTLEQIEVIKGRYEFVGEKSLIFNIPRSATCVALCACSVLILTLEKYEKILEEFPDYREKNVREWMFTRGGARPQLALRQ